MDRTKPSKDSLPLPLFFWWQRVKWRSNLNLVFRPILHFMEDWIGADQGLDDEFDCAPFFHQWKPIHYPLPNVKVHRQLIGLFEMMRLEFTGWIRIYRTALQHSQERAGILEKVLKCALQASAMPPPSYLVWLQRPQAEFENFSPSAWFLGRQLGDLEQLLQGKGLKQPVVSIQ